jgi:DNA end-binding protein Ku
MVGLATQLIERQTGTYEQADAEDRYEARLRELIEAKLRGEGLSAEPEPEADRGNVIDLMAALKRSLGETSETPARGRPAAKAKPASPGRKPAAPKAATSKAATSKAARPARRAAK